MARYRLRFLLQEFDLSKGTTLIGRSADCHVTIEDPLVSRQHARILIDGDDAMLEDLGSRNGVKLNGVAIKGTHPLKDGDRLRIGTQELVFCRVEQAAQASAKTTGFLRHCVTCRLPPASPNREPFAVAKPPRRRPSPSCKRASSSRSTARTVRPRGLSTA